MMYINMHAEFVYYLHTKNMNDPTKLDNDNNDWHYNRLKTQKYVYLAKFFGLDFKFNVNIHLNGPYSNQLTKDFDNIIF